MGVYSIQRMGGVPGCSHGCGLAQGREQAGGREPQGMGGNITSPPQ